jgi:hypothetical protein
MIKSALLIASATMALAAPAFAQRSLDTGPVYVPNETVLLNTSSAYPFNVSNAVARQPVVSTAAAVAQQKDVSKSQHKPAR